MKRFIDTAGYYVTDEPSFMEQEHAMTEELANVLGKLHMDVIKGKAGTADRLIQLIGKHPRNPQIKNLLTTYYLVVDQPEKAYAYNRKTIEAHPDYFFGKLNLVQEYIHNLDYEKIKEILGENFDLGELYPERDTFHVSEAMAILKFAVIYFAHKKDFRMAETFIDQMKEIDEDDFEVENAEEILFFEILEQMASIRDEEAKNRINVEVPQQDITSQIEKPVFHHPEIEILYQHDINIPIDELEQILLLPRATLIEDLVKVINDGIERYSYFENQDSDDEEKFFVFHAINLLAELNAIEQLPVVLNLLKQSEELIEFYLGYYLTEYILQSIYKLGNNQFHVLENFMKEPGIYTYSKTAVSEAIKQKSFESKAHRKEAIQCYSNILKFYAKAELEDNVIDSELIGHILGDIMKLECRELIPEITELFNLNYVLEKVCGDLETVEQNLTTSNETNYEVRILPLKDLYPDIKKSWLNSNNNPWDTNDDESPNPFYENDKLFIAEKKVGRNDPCICGSGKKYKKCCL
jgi:hypothetical protein